MRFISTAQRKAVMARLMSGQRTGMRYYRKTSKYVRKQYKATPDWVKGAVVGGAAVLATRPVVTHVPRVRVLKEWGPYLGAYAAGPVAGYLGIQAAKGRSPKEVWRNPKERKALGGLALTGMG